MRMLREFGSTATRGAVQREAASPAVDGTPHDSYPPVVATTGLERPHKQMRLLVPDMLGELSSAGDLLTVFGTALIAFGIYVGTILGGVQSVDRYALGAMIGGLAFVFIMQQTGAYQLDRLSKLQWQMLQICGVWGVVIAGLLVAAFVTKTTANYSRIWAAGWIIGTPFLIMAERAALAWLIRLLRKRGHLLRHVAVVGAGEHSDRLIRKLINVPAQGVSVVGVFDDRTQRRPQTSDRRGVIGTTDDLVKFARHAAVDEIVIALPPHASGRLKSMIAKLRMLPVDVRVSLEPISEGFPVKRLVHVGEAAMLEVVERPLKQWHGVIKWLEDKIIAVLALAALGPLMLLIALLIKLDSRGPVLFAQKRYGYNNRIIQVLKFRTMYVDAGDASGGKRTVRDDPRVTRLGRFLRKWSLDELPQLINVLRGDMSIVGPRPHAVAMKAGEHLYGDAVTNYMHRHRIRPGLTGWAQVSGLRGEVDSLAKARARVEHDVYYIENWSLLFDIQIMLRSVRVVLDAKSAY
jgi:polysaccharide biosynthesis protein PslA